MRRITSVVAISVATLFFISILIVSGQTSPDNHTIQPPKRIFTTNNSQGILNKEALFVFGPDICTAYGDPYSPANSIYTNEHPYTYKYHIVIPPDYPDDVLRIELFDPDSINQNITEAVVSYTDLAIANGFSITPETLGCPANLAQSQTNNCLIDTGEYSLTLTIPGVDPEQVNPIWYVRVDENRGSVFPGTCREPTTYTPAYNTATLFALYYNHQNSDGTVAQVNLASYTGQVGDGARDDGSHQTDLRWVSPGGTPSPDQATFVPVDPSSLKNFELNLAQDLPGIVVDPVTNERIVYLDVTSLDGASKNNFAIWAGPDDDTATLPGDVNARNLYILNNPGAHHPQGVEILADEARPLHVLFDKGMDVPLMHLGPEYAGQTTNIDIFDPDTGSLPPINFYLDTLAYTPDDSADGFDEAQTDWAISFGAAGDPSGGCFTNPDTYTYGCQDEWVSYAITLPSDLDCDSSGENCTPFYGGRLMARFNGGSINGLYDASTWLVDEPNLVTGWDNSQGCTAFPIGVDEYIRSVLEPTDPSSAENQWRDDFDYPTPEPDYYRYINHQPNVPLLDAKPGYLYNLQNGESAGGQGWLVWNQCIASDASALTDSLTWPGNSKDYSPTGGQCSLNGETMYRFPGYMEMGDNTDREMHVNDWVALNTGNVNSTSVRNVLEEHVNLDRTLRLLVFGETSWGSGIRISRFGLFRIVGYNLNSGGGEPFLLGEFVGWDDSCGQIEEPSLTGGDGPGGVGRTDGTTNLALWLQADDGAYTDAACTPGAEASPSETVACWADQSGNDHHATEAANGPVLQTAGANGRPLLQFNGADRYLDNTLDLNGRSGFTFFQIAQAASEADYQSIFRFQDAADSYIIYPDASQLSLSSDQGSGNGTDAGFVANEWNMGTAVYQLNTVDGMRTYHNGTLVAERDSGSTPLPADSLTIGRNSATQTDYTNADVAELIVYDRDLHLAKRTLVENYLSAKYNLPIANDKYDGDNAENGDFDMNVAGIGRESDGLHTSAQSAGMIVINNTFLRDNGDYLLFGHRTASNDNTLTNVPQDDDWATAPDPQRWTRHWYINVTDEPSTPGGGIDIILDFSEAGMTGLPAEPASNYRLLKRTADTGIFTDIATATAVDGDQVIFSGVDVALLGSNFTLGTLDAGQSPTAVMLETAVAYTSSPGLLILLTLVILLGLPTYLIVRRKVV